MIFHKNCQITGEISQTEKQQLYQKAENSFQQAKQEDNDFVAAQEGLIETLTQTNPPKAKQEAEKLLFNTKNKENSFFRKLRDKLKNIVEGKEKEQNIDLPDTKILSNGIKVIKVKGGDFMMGSDKYNHTKPVHKVTLTDYYIGETEVTNAQYATFLNDKKPSKTELDKWINLNGSFATEKCRISKQGDNYVVEKGYENHPVIYVSWFGANEFCKHYGGFLPSEAQWEYAARGGNKSQNNYKYAGSNDLNEVAWYDKNSYYKGSSHKDYGTHEVKTKKANELGLYDMSGNVWEWCQDWYDEKYYEKSNNLTNPINNSKTDYRVVRGGSWSDYPAFLSCCVP